MELLSDKDKPLFEVVSDDAAIENRNQIKGSNDRLLIGRLLRVYNMFT